MRPYLRASFLALFAVLVTTACADPAPSTPPEDAASAPDVKVDSGDDAAPDVNKTDASAPDDGPDVTVIDVPALDIPADVSGDASADVPVDRPPACVSATCGGHGQCAEPDAGAPCRCDTGWAGERCDRCDETRGYHSDGRDGCTNDVCVPSPCTDPTRSRCVAAMGMARCDCNAGTHEEGGRCVPDASCTPTTCSGHGACALTGGVIRCTCATGFTGERCETCDASGGYHADGAGGCTRDACTPNPCRTALRTRCTVVMDVARCDCDAGHHLEGDRCVVDETCNATTCNGHGTCSVAMGRASCVCATGYTGARCDACAARYHADGRGGCTNDPCTPNPCTAANQTVCTVAMGMARCGCNAGYHPDGVGGCTNDPCRPDPCAASGRACRNNAGSAECYTPMCDDRNPCTDDAFMGGRCVYTPRADGASCSTGVCRMGETCRAGACTGGANVVCDDRNPCTRDRCDAVMGCVATPDDTLVPDDGVACTVGRCAGGVASHTPNHATCDDGMWCTGAEMCTPGATGADARGCSRSGVPTAPGPNTGCRRYRCDEAMRAFVMEGSAPGTRCDDGLACTTSDVCDAAGACLGTATATCAPPTGTCGSMVGLPTTIDFGAGTVTGRFTMNGTAIPMTSRSSATFVYYLRATDTGALHEMGRITYGGLYPNYTRGADTYSTLVPAGVYDVLIRRAYDSGTRIVSQPETSDTTPGVYRVAAANVVVPVGGRRLDVDFNATTVSGRFTMNGTAIPMTSRSSATFVYYLRESTTGALHEMGRITYGGLYPNYTRGADTFSTLVPSGTYDVLARRSYDSSTQIVSQPEATDTTPGIYRVLRSGVVISGATQTLNVDFSATSVSGRFTMNGASIPMTSRSSATFVYYLRATDTGALHEMGRITYGGLYPNYTRGADTFSTLVPSGTYDVLARRAYDSSTQIVSQPEATDTTPGIYRVLQRSVTVTGATQTLNADFGATTVSGRFTMNGASIPMTSRSSATFVYYLRATDTGALHEMGRITYGGLYPNYTRGADTFSTLVPSGTYDVLARRAYDSSTQIVSQPEATDTTPGIYRVLQRSVTVMGTTQTLNADFGATTVSGRFTMNGASIPMTSRSSATFVYYLRATDTGALHEMGRITYGGLYPNYTRGADTFRTLVPSGTYDVLARRSYDSSTQIVSQPETTDTTPGIYRVLRAGIAVSGTAQNVDVNFGAATVAGNLSMNGAPIPMTSRSSSTFVYYLRARDTGALHEVARVTYGGLYPNYTRSADAWRTLVPTGTYDILARRAYDSSTQIVSQPEATDTTPGIYRFVGVCNEVR